MIRHVVVLSLAFAVAACSRQKAADVPPPALVRVLDLAAADDNPLELRGSVAAQSRIRLGFKQPGVVATVHVHEGARVRKGQLVAVLDEIDARAQLRMAIALRDKAKRDADRAARLVQEGAVAASARDDAQSQLEAAEAQVAQAEDAHSRTKLFAPEAGTVFARLAEPGEMVGAGSPVLLVDTTGALVVKASATERELSLLAIGQHATLENEAGLLLAGRVTSLAGTPNPQDGLYMVEVTPTDARRLLPGTLLRVRFEGTRASGALRIPLEALVHRQDRDFVFRLDEGTHVHQVPIEVGEAEGQEIAIRSGLRGGERIVAEGAYFLQDGQTVRALETERR